MVDFATKLDKVAAKLAEVGPSWTKVGLKLAPRWRQDGPKQEKSSPGPGHRGQGGVKEGSRRVQAASVRLEQPLGEPLNQRIITINN